uniref:Putative odorant receptor 27 n=1 Tax=Conopomorpha sinensis TaxID=940481 RepID=A0A3S7SGK0_9NEOP|nr:putative odorant receptor 27 [Conopomorpha sinensis]
MFIYIIICSLMICASAIQLTMDGTTKMQQIWIAEYIGALIVQLFIYCWHSNEVLVMSCTVEGGLYKSSWWRRGVRVRRCIIMLGAHLNRRVVFSAGPFTNLNISTFIAILKGSYSYYAILNKN